MALLAFDDVTRRFGRIVALDDVSLDVEARRVHVLDFGRRTASRTPAEVQSDRPVVAAYLGAE